MPHRLALLLTSLSLLGVSGQAEVGAPWAMFGGSPSHGGYGASSSLIPSAGGVAILWTFQTYGAVQSSPAIAADGSLFIGSDDKHIYSLRSDDGTLLWAAKGGGEFDSSPAIGLGGVLFVGSMYPDNRVRAYNMNATGYSGGGGGGGSLVWDFLAGSSVKSSPVLGNNSVYIGSDDGYVYALDAKTGGLLWAFKTNGFVQAAPALSPDGLTLYAASMEGNNAGTLFALDATTGVELWRYPAAGPIEAAPSITPDGVFVVFGDAAGKKSSLFCVFATNGTTVWRTPSRASITTPAAFAFINTPSPVVIVAADYPVNALFAYSLTWGAQVWNTSIGSVAFSAPAVDEAGFVVVGSMDANVYALNALNGAILWKIATGGLIVSSPALAFGRVFIGCDDGTVIAIGMPASTPPWWKMSMAMTIAMAFAGVALLGAVFLWLRPKKRAKNAKMTGTGGGEGDALYYALAGNYLGLIN